MAIINGYLGELRGSIAGNVFSHNKGGDYVRAGTTPTNPNTARQQTTRAFLGGFAQDWTNVLDDDEREEWNDYADTHPVLNSLGQEVKISGLAWYVACNSRLADAGASAIAEPPPTPGPGDLEGFEITLSGTNGVNVAFTTELAATERLQLWSSLPVSQGSSPNKRQCRLVGYSAAEAESPAGFVLPFNAQTGQKVVMFCGIMDQYGQVGPDSTDSAVFS